MKVRRQKTRRGVNKDGGHHPADALCKMAMFSQGDRNETLFLTAPLTGPQGFLPCAIFGLLEPACAGERFLSNII